LSREGSRVQLEFGPLILFEQSMMHWVSEPHAAMHALTSLPMQSATDGHA
jgi:hypothetical protein